MSNQARRAPAQGPTPRSAGSFACWQRLHKVDMDSTALFWLVLSCGIGMGISWAGFWCQSLVSATTYTVVGVMNKMLTVTVNVLIWDKHASTSGIASLALCLVGGSLYQQSPLRDKPPSKLEEVKGLTAYTQVCVLPPRRRPLLPLAARCRPLLPTVACMSLAN